MLIAGQQVEPEIEEIVIKEVITFGWLWVVVVHVVIVSNHGQNDSVREVFGKQLCDA